MTPLTAPQTYAIQDHETIALSDPNQAWRIQSGHMALCRIKSGKRQCFFTVSPGEVLFGATPQDTELVAIALEPTVVESV
ncbi:MAG: hypothetical protein F6J97_07160 [Leptolyngbya sp. SIO4C1]|nr:hypothetical protein [Leptolyngbya sp. SIO4C1]